MSPEPKRAVLTIALWLVVAIPTWANDPTKPAKSTGVAAQAARDAVAKFEAGWNPYETTKFADNPPWKVRVQALVALARIGADAVPVLVDALKNGKDETRVFAAQALALLAEPAARPALLDALGDPVGAVRIYAMRGLRMLGTVEAVGPVQKILDHDPDLGVKKYMADTLERDDTLDPAAIRRAIAQYDLSQLDTARLGAIAPDFALTDVLGRHYRLSQFRGDKPVVLVFVFGWG